MKFWALENLDIWTSRLFVYNDSIIINQKIRGRIQVSRMHFLFPREKNLAFLEVVVVLLCDGNYNSSWVFLTSAIWSSQDLSYRGTHGNWLYMNGSLGEWGRLKSKLVSSWHLGIIVWKCPLRNHHIHGSPLTMETCCPSFPLSQNSLWVEGQF